MGFGLSSIGNAVKSAVSHVSDAVSGAAKSVGDGAKAAEGKVAGVLQGAWNGIQGNDGFDHSNGNGPVLLVDSKPKGGSSRADAGSSGTMLA